ncbi:MAG: hypothetical protein HYR85_09800, partial [Planctomycetes bacterium]|nr:hypothetical protein [Planctomycetota bacterium]
MKRRLWAALASAIVLVALGARADVVYLRAGGKVEGVVVSEGSDSVQVKTRFGMQTIARVDVLRIEKKDTPEQIYAQRLASLKADDVAGFLDLARFCKENKLTVEWKAALEKVVSLDSDNAEAQTGLGRVKFDGAWMTPAEKA